MNRVTRYIFLLMIALSLLMSLAPRVAEAYAYAWFAEPTPTPTPQPSCCSSVLFIPGLEASRLYKDTIDTAGTTSLKLWEPHRNDNVRSLFLNAQGESLDATVHTNDVIDTVKILGLPFGTIYADFMHSLDTLVDEGKITEWNAAPYDWRLDIKDIADNNITTATSTYALQEKAEELAQRSKTGKVTIVAHSNGGLIAKILVDRLSQQGKSDLIDKLILVAVPELGTPSAVAALLHGYDQSLGKGMVLKTSVAREFGENMPGAYGLLPSAEYFAQVTDPIIFFDKVFSENSAFKNMYEGVINNYDRLKDFLLGREGREKPQVTDVAMPNILNSTLLSNAETHHSMIDTWVAPAGIKVIELAGWGLSTIKAIMYSSQNELQCTSDGTVCRDVEKLVPKPVYTKEGDKTVVYPSALTNTNTEKYFMNLGAYNKANKTNNEHKDILENDAVREAITQFVSNNEPTSSYITQAKPTLNNVTDTIQVAMHSPASINIYDRDGNHTGPILNPDETSDLLLYEEKIPDSYYDILGEGVYAGFPAEDGSVVNIQGTGVGTFTFDVSRLHGDEVVASSTFEYVPVTPLLTAEMVIASTTTSPILSIDVNGDGVSDVLATSSPKNDPLLFLKLVKETILSFNLPQAKEQKMIKKIDKIAQAYSKNKKDKVEAEINKFVRKLQARTSKNKNMTDTEKTMISELMMNFLDAIN